MPDDESPDRRHLRRLAPGQTSKRFAMTVGEVEYAKAAAIAQRHGVSVGEVFRKAFRVVTATAPEKLR
jgi:hypothetical protein